ncbi:MFS transporter [Polymorphospora lycopeni]|uniref:MFS transporter n=1 Tax=Polymorphospora lycopeni TaxID=3140240 RepID=A0ABV5CJM2_9ACTN
MTTVKSPAGDPARLRRARVSVFGTFGVGGLLLAMWVVNIPAVQQRTGVSHATLGLLLLLIGAGAFAGMQVSGPLADRIGSRTTTVAGAALLCVTVNLPGLAYDAVTLGLALFFFGFANGALDVAMNAQAVVVERAYRRPIMSAFHALFSIGGAAGAVLGAGLIAAGWSVSAILLASALAGVVVMAACVPGLLPRGDENAPTAQAASGVRRRAGIPRTVWLLGATAFLLMLAEGVANDWSALQITEHLGEAESVAALGYGAFAVTMTLGRLVTDRIVMRVGPVAVVRYGSLIGAAGLVLVTTSDWLWLTLAGWAVLGLGLSGSVPQLFTAAGNLREGTQGVNMSRVVGMGYLGLLAGPALVGWIAEFTSLNVALFAPLLFCLVAAVLAVSLRPTSAEPAAGSAVGPAVDAPVR